MCVLCVCVSSFVMARIHMLCCQSLFIHPSGFRRLFVQRRWALSSSSTNVVCRRPSCHREYGQWCVCVCLEHKCLSICELPVNACPFGTFFVLCHRRRCHRHRICSHSEPRQQIPNLPSAYACVSSRMCPPDNLVKSNGNITSHRYAGHRVIYSLYIFTFT